MSTARAELDARESSKRVEQPPFVFELPESEGQYDALVGVADACSARVEQLLEYRKQATMFTLLCEQEVRRDAGSRWGYLAVKAPCRKICLLRGRENEPLATAMALVYQYVVLVAYELTRGCAPRWLTDGLGQLIVRQVLGAGPLPTSPRPAIQLEASSVTERALELAVGRSRFDRLADSTATTYALVAQLIERYGEASMAQFVRDLVHRSEGRAFRRAFGVSQRRFERECHDRLRREEEQP